MLSVNVVQIISAMMRMMMMMLTNTIGKCECVVVGIVQLGSAG